MRKKIRIVVDTNIFINSWFSSKHLYCDAVIDLISKNEAQLLFSQDTIGELFYVIKNIVLHLFDDNKDRLEYLYYLSCIFLDSISVNTLEIECPKLYDPFDEMFLKTAIKGEADFIISNDFRSGIHSIQIEGLRILSAEDFISVYEGLVK